MFPFLGKVFVVYHNCKCNDNNLNILQVLNVKNCDVSSQILKIQVKIYGKENGILLR
jgi:hypothetical protein